MKIHENFLEEKKFTALSHFILSNTFSMTYNATTGSDKNKKHLETPQMCRSLYYRNNTNGNTGYNQQILIHEYYWTIPHLHDLIGQFAQLDVMRMKVNLLQPYPNAPEYHAPHKDVWQGEPTSVYRSFLYYLNDSDGDTFFFDDKGEVTDRITPKANTCIEFDSSLLHASSNPTLGPRYVLNTIMSNSMTGLN